MVVTSKTGRSINQLRVLLLRQEAVKSSLPILAGMTLQ